MQKQVGKVCKRTIFWGMLGPCHSNRHQRSRGIEYCVALSTRLSNQPRECWNHVPKIWADTGQPTEIISEQSVPSAVSRNFNCGQEERVAEIRWWVWYYVVLSTRLAMCTIETQAADWRDNLLHISRVQVRSFHGKRTPLRKLYPVQPHDEMGDVLGDIWR